MSDDKIRNFMNEPIPDARAQLDASEIDRLMGEYQRLASVALDAESKYARCLADAAQAADVHLAAQEEWDDLPATPERLCVDQIMRFHGSIGLIGISEVRNILRHFRKAGEDK